jgi:hypothetical protein
MKKARFPSSFRRHASRAKAASFDFLTSCVLMFDLLLLLLGVSIPVSGVSGALFDEDFLNLTEISIDLSLTAYFDDPENRGGYDLFKVFEDSDDRAIVASKFDACFVAFRGVRLRNVRDVAQALTPGKAQFCQRQNANNCCSAAKGTIDAFQSDYMENVRTTLQSCTANTCSNPDECVVLTGHSQGGSIAQVAAVAWSGDLNPRHVITFGTMPAGLSRECGELLNETRWFNFGNTRETRLPPKKLLYDSFPFAPVDRGLVSFGTTCVLSDGGVASLGLNFDQNWPVTDWFSLLGMHLVGSYREKIQALTARSVAENGFADGSLCTDNA